MLLCGEREGERERESIALFPRMLSFINKTNCLMGSIDSTHVIVFQVRMHVIDACFFFVDEIESYSLD